uniref:protein-serine/threonine phosphatase n=1 Tax=Globodera rostochiensis TaxID=31243 RepID=A0A914HFH5_GLORO
MDDDDDELSDFELKARPVSLVDTLNKSTEELETEARIKAALKHIMQSVDLDEVTSQDIRRRLNEQIIVDLRRHKEFIDHQMLVILGQLDKPSKIFEYLYLGTEWNASNWEELKENGVQFILNVTKEVDNFFPDQFKYLKICVSDESTTELFMHWQRTYEFIREAKEKGAKVLVHCKKGISRSASTVVAYAMKEYTWGLDAALEHVKRKRDCITPNPGFMEQLQTFQGMLQASNNRHKFVDGAVWTEQDDAKRIAKIKADEKRLFEEQMGIKLAPSTGGGTSGEGIIADEEIDRPPTSPKLHHAQSFKQHYQQMSADQSIFNSTINRRPADLWCFHCASPWNAISEPMQRVIKNLLEIRRAEYPAAQMMRRDCVEPKDLDGLPRQICRGYSHCQTLILTDHGSGSAFTMRGCAERFGAVDVHVLARRGDNMCKRLHEKVDIQECICERRKYCHAGAERASTLQFTPMSGWQQNVPSAALDKTNLVPAPEALQRNSGRRRRPKNWETTAMVVVLLLHFTHYAAAIQIKNH